MGELYHNIIDEVELIDTQLLYFLNVRYPFVLTVENLRNLVWRFSECKYTALPECMHNCKCFQTAKPIETL